MQQCLKKIGPRIWLLYSVSIGVTVIFIISAMVSSIPPRESTGTKCHIDYCRYDWVYGTVESTGYYRKFSYACSWIQKGQTSIDCWISGPQTLFSNPYEPNYTAIFVLWFLSLCGAITSIFFGYHTKKVRNVANPSTYVSLAQEQQDIS